MNHKEIVTILKSYSSQNEGIKSLITLGSYARGDLEPYSDLDIVMISDENPDSIFLDLEEKLVDHIRFKLTEEASKRIYLLGDTLLKLDLIIAKTPDEVKTLYLGSRITNATESIVLDKTSSLTLIFQKWVEEEPPEDVVSLANSEVEKFLVSFEAASSAARREDVFQSYFHYNLSLTRYIRLLQLQMEDPSFLYCPKRIMNRLPAYQIARLERMGGTLRLYELRGRLDQLATEFREAHSKLFWKYPGIIRSPKQVDRFLREVLDRDLLWNFRDVAWACPDVVKNGALFRSSALPRFEQSDALRKVLKANKIQRIIDLRLPWEIDRYPYRNTVTEIVTIPMSIPPPEDRRIFSGNWPNLVLLLNCDSEIKHIFTRLSEGVPTAIHCHAGRDRTGVVVALVMLAIGVPIQYVKKDFLSSNMGLKADEFDILVEAVNSHGGVESILSSFEIDEKTIERIRKWLRRNE